MKYTNLRALEKHLEGSAPKLYANVYMVIAKEAFDRRMALEKLQFHLNGQQKTQSGIKSFDGDGLNIETALYELNNLSFFSENVIVVIQNADKLKKAAQVSLEGYFSHINKRCYLILIASSITSTTNFYKSAEKVGVILDIPAEKPWEKEKSLAEWVSTTITLANKKIHPSVCQNLVKQMGTDQSIFQQEIEKLLCYIGDRSEVTQQDVNAISSSINGETIWQLGEAIFQKNAKNALRICHHLLEDGGVLLVLLKQIRNQFQTSFQICSILTTGGGNQEVSAAFPYMKGMILDRNVQTAQAYGMERFKKGLIWIDEADTQAKNSSVDQKLIAEMLIIRLTT